MATPSRIPSSSDLNIWHHPIHGAVQKPRGRFSTTLTAPADTYETNFPLVMLAFAACKSIN